MRYTITDLQTDFPDDAACLRWLVEWLYPNGVHCIVCKEVRKHSFMKTRRSISCNKCGHHVYPTAGTIFHNSRTPLTLWFYAIFLMTATRSGLSAKQLQREIGVTYKTAWRMLYLIRSMMREDGTIGGFGRKVEIDETYVHPNTYKRSSAQKRYGRSGSRTGEVLFGATERGGKVRIWHVRTAGVRVLMPIIEGNIVRGSTVYSDGFHAYRTLDRRGYYHFTTNHSLGQYVDGDNYTQNIENVWSHLKRGIKGVYRHVSAKYLQNYADEFAFRYSHRKSISMFWSLMCCVTSSVQPSSKLRETAS